MFFDTELLERWAAEELNLAETAIEAEQRRMHMSRAQFYINALAYSPPAPVQVECVSSSDPLKTMLLSAFS